MGVNLFSNFRRPTSNDEIVEEPTPTTAATDQEKGVNAADVDDTEEKPEEVPDESAQTGVQDIEAMTLAWTKASLISTFVL